MRSTLLHVRLLVPTPIDPPEPNHNTWFLQSIVSFSDLRVLAFGAAGTTKHPNMGRVAAQLVPRQDGTFAMELGVVLHDRLPLPDGRQEYSFAVPGERTDDLKDLYFSNQLVRVRFLRERDPEHLTCPLYRLEEVRTGQTDAPADAPFEYLNTAVSARYTIAGGDAEDALSTHLEASILDFIARINRVVAAHLLIAPDNAGLLTPSYDYGSFGHMYLLMAGDDPAKLHVERLGLSLSRNALVTANYNADQSEVLRAYVSGASQPDDITRILRSAKGYIDGGILHLALLQLAIAAELATTQFVHGEYLRRGVSKTKLDDRKAEITFSIMLNIEVIALAPSDAKPDRKLIGKIDRIRNLRNDLMHYGRFSSSQQELRELHNATREYTTILGRMVDGSSRGAA